MEKIRNTIDFVRRGDQLYPLNDEKAPVSMDLSLKIARGFIWRYCSEVNGIVRLEDPLGSSYFMRKEYLKFFESGE